MGKPKGDGGRSKARPSSSSQAASLLSPGVSTLGFGGYLGSSRVESSSVGEEAGSSSSEMDGELAQHLKRLSRKDPITKVKALTTLSTLFKQVSASELARIIPKWAFEYRKLLFDYSRDVRRYTHEAMTSLVACVRRGLAPHLKSLMGPWWFSQFDPVAEVAQAARRSLEAAFPAQEKRLDALVLCATEIFLYLEENLRLKPQEMIEKSLPPDELEEMHDHVISSSLLAVATLLDVLIGAKLQIDGSDVAEDRRKGPLKAIQSIDSSAERIFSAHNWFLGFFKSKSPRVRSATYSILGTYIKHMPHAFNVENIKLLSAAILSVFGEKDPSCHSSMWDMVLLFSRKFPESWYNTKFEKNSFPRLWSFLRNGCYGSQQVSYPILILFLDSMPLKTVFGESFLLKFFQNFWAGRNPHSSSSDQAILFNALKECFLWGLFNSSRYFSGEEDIFEFQGNLIVNVLVALLLHGYLLPVRKDQEELLTEKSKSLTMDDSQILNARLSQGSGINFPLGYFQEMARCIIIILSNISLRKSSLLQMFCVPFQKDCLYILQQEEDGQRHSEHAERINNFLLLVDELAVQQNELWPLNHMAGPLFAKLLPLLRSLDSPNAVNILCTMVEIFGPRMLVSQVYNLSDLQTSALSYEDDDKLMANFLDIFKDDFIPFCMENSSLSGNSRLDLLISLFEKEIVSEQWLLIMVYAERKHKDAGNDYLCVLAMLMGKIREKVGSKTLRFVDLDEKCWHHNFLNSVAVSTASQSVSFDRYEVSFLCEALGGSSVFDQTCFLSKETVLFVFDEILKKLIRVVHTSAFNWAKSLRNSWDLLQKVEVPPTNATEMAQMALEIINTSMYCLKRLDSEEYRLVASILASVFIIGWEDNIRSVAHVDDRSYNSVCSSEAKDDGRNDVYLGKKILGLRSQTLSSFLRSLSFCCRAYMEDILVLTIRAAISDADIFSVENITTLCCRWVVGMLKDICVDGVEEQEVLTKLLAGSESWTFWVSSYFSCDDRSASIRSEAPNRTHEFMHQSFSSFVSKLVLNIGFGKVISGNVSIPSEQSPYLLQPRPWLAAELLCSWSWHGTCASDSFLPLLNDFAKTESSPEQSIIWSVAKILIDGAIVHAATDQPSILNAWILSYEEVERIQNTYLRALMALLLTLIVKDNTWAEEEAYFLLDYTLDKLYVGAEVDLSCLKILPFILNVTIQALRNGEPASDRFHRYVSSWLEKALSLPHLALTQTAYNDSVEWMYIIISCYPLCIFKETTNIQVKVFQFTSHVERTYLLSLFRRQRCFLGDNSAIRAQTILANLTAVTVGYCWQEFDDLDWDYVLSQMQLWTNSSVLMMEETTENIDAIICNAQRSSNLNTILKNIENAVETIIPSPINMTRIALIIFSLVRQHAESATFQPTGPKTWESIKDGIFEHTIRLFLSTGVTEAIAGSLGGDVSSIIASKRLIYSQFWELVSFCVIDSPNHLRALGLKSIELWGLSKGPVDGLFAILFSQKPLSSLQLSAFHTLSSEPVSRSSIVKETWLIDDNQGETVLQSTIDESSCFREEISSIITNPSNEVLKMELTSQQHVNMFLAWALLLSYLQSLPPSSSLRTKLVLCIQDSISPIILDLIFQQFPLKGGSLHAQKKKEVEVPSETTKAANGAKLAISSCSLLFAVEMLWPVSVESMAVIAGSVYGLMIRLLPAYVRNWFTALRDRSLSQSIESFTKVWCSPSLFSEELSQIKGAAFGDDNFSVSVNKSALEIIATYKKEESGMDLVIHLPGCYPLKPVDVDCTRSLGVSEVKQRKWLLSLTAFVCNQNGAIAEAIRTWKSNLEREFEGVEECPICYSIIHTTNHSLPRLACKTCKHKFHSACLYRWFSTSHKSTCPLCQTPF